MRENRVKNWWLASLISERLIAIAFILYFISQLKINEIFDSAIVAGNFIGIIAGFLIMLAISILLAVILFFSAYKKPGTKSGLFDEKDLTGRSDFS